MNVYSELIKAQAENLSTDPAAGIKGRIYHKSTAEPLKVDDGTTLHKVLTDQNYTALISSNHEISAAVGGTGFQTSSTTYVDVTNLTVTITTNGRPVEVSGILGTLAVSTTSTPMWLKYKILRDAVTVAEEVITGSAVGLGEIMSIRLPLGAIRVVDEPAAGTYTYKIQVAALDASTACDFTATCKIMAKEF